MVKDLTGQRFGRLTVIEQHGMDMVSGMRGVKTISVVTAKGRSE